MQNSFAFALKEVLKDEGGYVNNPKDPGGATNKGITQAVYDAYRSKNSRSRQTVKLVSDAEVQAIYKAQYWDAVHGDILPVGLDYAVFDFAVNSGPLRAIRFLQSVLGVKITGTMDSDTVHAALSADVLSSIRKLCDQRLDFLKFLRTWPTFGKGWEKRVEGVKSTALHMALHAPVVVREAPPATPTTQVPPKAKKPLHAVLKAPKRVAGWLKSKFS